ncbi:MAG: alpha/beta hydrolase fold protein [Myxococcaceae bacterium]|nr:alpha/beta hydrolase fold protein [Myxococcaceae bacterium]
MGQPLSIHFEDDGPGQASALLPVVFLHAFPYHGGMWAAQRAALQGVARFVSFDVRGIGPSATPTGAYMLEHLVDDLFALLEQRGISRCVLCGLSLGGYVALRAVVREPTRIRGLLLSDMQAGADSDEAKLGRAAGLRLLRREGLEAFTEAQLQRQLSPHTLSARPELLQRLRSLISDSSLEGIASSLVALATRTCLQAALSEIRVPTSIVVGADDTITPPAVAQRMSEQIPGAELHVLPRAGHLANLEAEPEFNRVLLALVARVQAT